MKKILYVDDEKVEQDKFLLASRAHKDLEIQIESQGSNVLTRVNENPPDILVVDWKLTFEQENKDIHFTDGIVVARSVRRIYPYMPIIILTSLPIGKAELDAEVEDPLTRHFSKRNEWVDIFSLLEKMFKV